MKLFLPDNIFSRLFAAHLPEDFEAEISYQPSSVISSALEKNESAVGLIPVMDLISHKDFYVSSKYGLSFENLLCNSYLYYTPDQKKITDIYLYGDISSQDVILSKIIFKELYDAAVEIHLLTDNNFGNKNLIISGDNNFIDNKFINGISVADEVSENINLPYVNYILVSTGKEALQSFHAGVVSIGEKIYKDVEKYKFDENLPDVSRDYIKSNISSLITDFDEPDIEGLEQIIRLPYFYGMIKDIVEIKYV